MDDELASGRVRTGDCPSGGPKAALERGDRRVFVPLRIPGEPVRRRDRADVWSDRRSTWVHAATARAHLSSLVDNGRDERGRPAVFRCLDPGWQDGHTEFAGQDRHLRAHVDGEAWSPSTSGALIVQDDAQQRTVDLDGALTLVLDEAQLSEFVQEEVHPRSSRTDHFRQRLL